MNTEGNSLPAVSGSERAGCLTTAKSADGSCAHSGASLLPLNVPAFPCKAKPPSKVIESRVQLEAIVPSHCHVESKLGKRKFQTSGMPSAYAFKDKKRSISDYSQEGEADEAGLSLLFAASLLQQKGTLSGEDTLDTVVFESATGAMQEGATNPKTLLKAHRRTTATGILSSATAVTTSVGYIEPTDNDVLCGRGGGINKHFGNIIYRRVVEYNKKMYKQVPKRHRMLVSRSIVQAILNGGGRFLQEQQTSAQTAWTEIQFRRAVQKTSQALRERSDDVHSPKNDDNVAEVDDQNRGNLAAPSAAATLTATSALQIEPFAYDKKPVDLSMNVKGAALHRKASTALVVPL